MLLARSAFGLRSRLAEPLFWIDLARAAKLALTFRSARREYEDADLKVGATKALRGDGKPLSWIDLARAAKVALTFRSARREYEDADLKVGATRRRQATALQKCLRGKVLISSTIPVPPATIRSHGPPWRRHYVLI